MKINIRTTHQSDCQPQELELFDAVYAYRQSLDPAKYKSDVEMTINGEYLHDDLNILLDYMPNSVDEEYLKKYDLIFLCNSGEPMCVGTPAMVDLLNNNNVYLISNSYLGKNSKNQLKNKIVCLIRDVLTCSDMWTKNFYPHYYRNIKNSKITRTNSMVAINGVNRAHRDYFFKILKSEIPEIRVLSNITTTPNKLIDSQWESQEDQQFREWINNLYADQLKETPPEISSYYDDSVPIGFDNRYGKIPPGYFIMPEYFQNTCVIFPETSWQNEELSITEKVLKCFYAGSLPFPIGGNNINYLYNELGFSTAWNLLPPELQIFDQVKDHVLRYRLTIESIKWLNQNMSVFITEQFHSMVRKNKHNMLNFLQNFNTTIQLNDIIQTVINKKLN